MKPKKPEKYLYILLEEELFFLHENIFMDCIVWVWRSQCGNHVHPRVSVLLEEILKKPN